MLKLSLTISIVIFAFAVGTYAQPNDWTQQLYDSIHFSENGKDIIVDLDRVNLSLSNGANPNRIYTHNNRDKSVLANYVELTSIARNPRTVTQGIDAINLLFKNKAKLQYCDGALLFWPITQGKCDIVRVLLINGANATFLA